MGEAQIQEEGGSHAHLGYSRTLSLAISVTLKADSERC